MLSGTVPFKANNMNELHKIIIKGNYQLIKDISEGIIYTLIKDAQSLLLSLLEIDPKKRITIEQIYNHPWLKFTETKSKTKSNLILFN
jgi:serine/threonine protein kinase